MHIERDWKNIIPNDEISYTPDQIFKWGKHIVETEDEYSSIFLREMVGDMLFQYFVNRYLDSSARYFVCKNKHRIYLIRERADEKASVEADYLVTTSVNDYLKTSKIRLTKEAAEVIDALLTEHKISHSIIEK